MLSPEELTFVACQTTSVDIVPSIRLEGVGMLYGDVPTLRPQIRCTVPLWLASTLRQSRHCRILAPAWLHPNHLEACLEEERAKPEEFCSGLPTRYLEIFHQLQRIAREDLQPDFYKLQQLIQAIKEVRWQKILYGLQSLDGSPLFVPILFLTHVCIL